MSFSLLPKTLVFSISIFSFLVNAESIYEQTMFRLNAENNSGSQTQTLTDYQGKTFITAFFMPNCKWCQRQHKVLNKMKSSCPAIKTIMLGVQGSKQKLRQALQRKKNTFPAYVANNTIVKAVGAQSPVPMMLLFNDKGGLVFKTIGYTPKEKLTALLIEHNINVCQT